MIGPRRSRAPEWAVLGLALVAASVLLVAAFLPGQDPEVAARASLAQLAGEVEDAATAEWRRALRELPARLGVPGPTLRWGEGAPSLPVVATDAGESPPSAAYAALAADAESERDPSRALQLASAALERADGTRARAESLLRLVQCARRANDDAAVQWAWLNVVGERVRDRPANEAGPGRGSDRPSEGTADRVPGSVAIAGVGAPLAIFLASAEALDPAWRARDAAELALAWSRGEIALPLGDASARESPLDSAQIDPRVEVLAERLADAAGSEREAIRDLLDRYAPRLRAASLERASGPLVARCEGSAWSLTARADALLASRASPGGGCEGFLLAVEQAQKLVVEALAPILPPDFVVDVTGASTKDALRPRVELVPGALGYTLRHADVEGWIASGSSRARGLRAGLVALAVLCAVAGALAARALARERHLGELRAAFVAGVSHELRTPVASILLLAENLESGRVDGDAARARYHGLIRREALRLRRLVDGVLDFSRLERGRGVEIAREDVDVRAWLASVAEDAREWARQQDVELEIDVGSAPAAARIDREALRRALWNLLENAQRHSGSKRFVLRARGGRPDASSSSNGSPEPSPREELILEVEDDGRGVALANRTAIFEPFARFAEPGTPGTGLGLALVREIARAHAGSIAALDGANGRGALFRLRLPVESETMESEDRR